MDLLTFTSHKVDISTTQLPCRTSADLSIRAWKTCTLITNIKTAKIFKVVVLAHAVLRTILKWTSTRCGKTHLITASLTLVLRWDQPEFKTFRSLSWTCRKMVKALRMTAFQTVLYRNEMRVSAAQTGLSTSG